MSRASARADRIRAEVSISSVLASYGYMVHVDAGGRQQQFSCDLHGDGTDSKPSARVYPETQQWYCFACGASRDAIQTVRDKEGLDFWGACDVLEKRFKLPPLPWVDGEEEGGPPASKGWEEVLEAPIISAEDGRARVAALLKGVTFEKVLTLNAILRLWEEYDRLTLLLEQSPEGLLDDFLTLRAKIVGRIQRAETRA